jgi:hypothetical protein
MIENDDTDVEQQSNNETTDGGMIDATRYLF